MSASRSPDVALMKAVHMCLQIQRRDQFDQVVIETTGLANPRPIIETLTRDPDMETNISLDGVVTVVDAKHVEQHLDDQQKSPDAVNEAVEQIAYADRILLNKVDLVRCCAMRCDSPASPNLLLYVLCNNVALLQGYKLMLDCCKIVTSHRSVHRVTHAVLNGVSGC